jgi:hypothetical protein
MLLAADSARETARLMHMIIVGLRSKNIEHSMRNVRYYRKQLPACPGSIHQAVS